MAASPASCPYRRSLFLHPVARAPFSAFHGRVCRPEAGQRYDVVRFARTHSSDLLQRDDALDALNL